MQICYIWVNHFKSLKDYSLNLSNNYKFDFDRKKNSIDLDEESTLLKDFFGESISSVTALLGVNGSGKTTALEMICRCITEQDNFEEYYILIYEIDRKFYVSTNLKMPLKANFQFISDNGNLKLKKLKTIYFSNIFDQNYIDFNEKVIDISLNRKMNPRYMFKDELLNTKGNVGRQIEFIVSPEFKDLYLDVPKRVEYKIFNSTADLFKRKKIKERLDPETFNCLSEILSKERIGIRRRGFDKTAILVAQQFLVSILCLDLDLIDIFHRNIQSYNDTRSLLKVISEQTDVSIGFHSLSEIIDILILRMDFWLEELNYDSDNTIRGSKHSFTLNFDLDNLWHHQKLSYVFETVIEGSATWYGISSGQKAYLNMFCSIWDCVEANDYDNNNGHCLICIDEGDLYLHPQWQIEFIDKLIKCLPTISNGKVQLILTTHSPLLISDIPKQCISITGGYTKTNIQTFGANLYDIYNSSFGLNNQRSGNLSSRYIDKILEIADKSSLTNLDVDDLKDAISIIDDELILHHIENRIKEL